MLLGLIIFITIVALLAATAVISWNYVVSRYPILSLLAKAAEKLVAHKISAAEVEIVGEVAIIKAANKSIVVPVSFRRSPTRSNYTVLLVGSDGTERPLDLDPRFSFCCCANDLRVDGIIVTNIDTGDQRVYRGNQVSEELK